MNAPPVRRNDPCPCGSGRRYKECHGALAAGPAAGATPEAAFERGMEAFRRRQPEAAIREFDAALARVPGHAFAIHYKGYALAQIGRIDEGIELLERARSMQPDNADFQGNLGTIRYVMGDLPAAVAALEQAIVLAPTLAEPHANLALALRDAGEFERALVHARRALELKPGLAAARLNLALVLLALGRFPEAWPAYAWRPDPAVNLRDPQVPNRLPHASALPGPTLDPWITLHGEQGLGDTLFFLRFAPRLRERGARLRFAGDARLAPLLLRTGVVDESCEAPDASRGPLVWVGDLPSLLGAGDVHPPALPLVADAAKRAQIAARLAALGPAPYVAITWRAGLPRRGKVVLAKEIAPAALGTALRGKRATFVSVQRDPQPGESEALAAALGARLHDFSSSHADLDEMLALMGAVDEYVGVSNTNTHLRAATGKAARVLVAFPPEWRWLARGDSPWFPGFALYRAARDGNWDEALARLAADLR